MMLKRTEPRARGSGNRILKRYSNVSLYLREKVETLDKNKIKKVKVAKNEVVKTKVVKTEKKTKSKLGEVK